MQDKKKRKKERKKETRVNPETGKTEQRYEGDTLWVVVTKETK